MIARPSLLSDLAAAVCGRLLAFVCCLLALTASLDSRLLLQTVCSSSIPQNSSPSEETPDDDDDMLHLTGSSPRLQVLRCEPFFSSLACRRRIASQHSHSALSLRCSSWPAAPASEHDFRNGIGAPLLC